jgi:hypothetical protein
MTVTFDFSPTHDFFDHKGNLKGQELANRCADDLAEAGTAVRSGMARVRRSPELPFSFLKYAGLSF